MRAPVAVLFLLTVSSACGTATERWLIPQVLVQPGSPVVVISNSKLRSVWHDGGGMFGGETTNHGVEYSTVAWTFQTLDVRTCKAGSVRRFTQSVEVVGWGTAPGELWVRRPDDAPTIRPLEGGAQLEIGMARAPPRGEDLPVRSGAAVTPGLLRVWDVDTRSMRDLPWSWELPLTRILSARPGDDTLVGLGAPGTASRSTSSPCRSATVLRRPSRRRSAGGIHPSEPVCCGAEPGWRSLPLRPHAIPHSISSTFAQASCSGASHWASATVGRWWMENIPGSRISSIRGRAERSRSSFWIRARGPMSPCPGARSGCAPGVETPRS